MCLSWPTSTPCRTCCARHCAFLRLRINHGACGYSRFYYLRQLAAARHSTALCNPSAVSLRKAQRSKSLSISMAQLWKISRSNSFPVFHLQAHKNRYERLCISHLFDKVHTFSRRNAFPMVGMWFSLHFICENIFFLDIYSILLEHMSVNTPLPMYNSCA